MKNLAVAYGVAKRNKAKKMAEGGEVKEEPKSYAEIELKENKMGGRPMENADLKEGYDKRGRSEPMFMSKGGKVPGSMDASKKEDLERVNAAFPDSKYINKEYQTSGTNPYFHPTEKGTWDKGEPEKTLELMAHGGEVEHHEAMANHHLAIARNIRARKAPAPVNDDMGDDAAIIDDHIDEPMEPKHDRLHKIMATRKRRS